VEIGFGLWVLFFAFVCLAAVFADRFERVDAGARDFLFGHFEQAEQRADRVRNPFFCADFGDHSVAERGHAHDCLVGFHLDDFLIGADRVADIESEADDGGLGDGFAELGHQDRDNGHGVRGGVWCFNCADLKIEELAERFLD
jgi:hypothetical protein